MNHERLRVTRFRKAKVQEGPAFVPIAKQMKAVAMPTTWYDGRWFRLTVLC